MDYWDVSEKRTRLSCDAGSEIRINSELAADKMRFRKDAARAKTAVYPRYRAEPMSATVFMPGS
jgi:hypothetical protein